jgi:hypothetical protein
MTRRTLSAAARLASVFAPYVHHGYSDAVNCVKQAAQSRRRF